MSAGKSYAASDACALGYAARAACPLRCGYRCSRARAEAARTGRAAGGCQTDEGGTAFQRAALAVQHTPLLYELVAAEHVAAARKALNDPGPLLSPVGFGHMATASPSVAADHANCGTSSCCRRCTPTQESTS